MSEEQTSVSETSSMDKKNGNNSSSGSAGGSFDNNGNGGQKNHNRQLVHSVSIVVEPVPLEDMVNESDSSSLSSPYNDGTTCYKDRQSPVILLEDFDLSSETGNEKSNEDDIVKSIIANARLRKEEFARLLEEHAKLVREINNAEKCKKVSPRGSSLL